MRLVEVTHQEKPPLWFRMAQKLLAARKPLAFSANFNVYDLRIQRVFDQMQAVVYYERPSKKGAKETVKQQYTIFPASLQDWTIVKQGAGYKLQGIYDSRQELIDESHDDLPLWYSLVQKAMAANKKVYFAAGRNEIVGMKVNRVNGKTTIDLSLQHVTRKKFGHPDQKFYTVWEKVFDGLTLTMFRDGYRLHFMKDPEPVKESVDEPMVVSMVKKILASGKSVYFRNRGGKISRVWRVTTGKSTSNKQMWWFYDTITSGNPLTWRSIDTIDKLSLKKDGLHWVLFDQTVKLKEGDDTPLIVSIMRRHIAKGGAVQLDVNVLPAGRTLKGWVTKPIEAVPAVNGLGGKMGTIYKLVTNDHPGGAKGKVFLLTARADETHTLKRTVDGNKNPVLKLVNRDEAI